MEELQYHYKYPRPAVTTDCVIFGFNGKDLKILLVKRGEPKPGDIPAYPGFWALPGGFLRVEADQYGEADYDALHSAKRKLEEETSLKDVYIEQLRAYTDRGRDPREWVITIAYYALIWLTEDVIVQAGNGTAEAKWVNIEEVQDMRLAFDHNKIVDNAIERLKNNIRYQPFGRELLPNEFTMAQYQLLYEKVLGGKLNRGNFFKKMESLGLLENTGETTVGGLNKQVILYRFNDKQYEESLKEGITFSYKLDSNL